jgi:hypothetical protein
MAEDTRRLALAASLPPPAIRLPPVRRVAHPAAAVPAIADAVPTAAPAPICGAPAVRPVAMPGPKMLRPRSVRRQRHGQHIVQGRLVAAEPLGELAEQAGADADDDGEH